ncbi:toll/interleukin-1 receptor domain-containing protein [Nitrosomonas communis]|uniref:toll/interleukin-1 receptor domain-containing protein n=1 Tax=Nitrosomonas communis TaxID=44574 RepID=UPI0026EE4CC1|nr:toll/interleukin-1 receptor domain-containing protein [Nitrosomonas communis]MCO6426975.1 toll/interleukin-1 receptor domain-containing protein [Nitrosomonas communis]
MAEKNIERLWDQLFTFIRDERVIPIVGPELLKIDIDGERTLLYTYLARQLAKKLEIYFEPTDSLSTVAGRYISQGIDRREDIYPELMNAMPSLTQDQLPDALVKLAEISKFKLFVTTSFDPLLVYALNQIRYGGESKTQVLAFSPESKDDLPKEFGQLDRVTVFHLFGKLSPIPDYVVTDEDVLEFMHALQSRTSRPDRLFDALNKQSLMVIGCPLSDWLGRFFVRIGKKERLIMSGGKTDFMAGDQLRNEKNLAEFLLHFSNRTKVFPSSSIEFVNELHQRWRALNPQTGQSANPIDIPVNDLDKMQQGAVFLSYASEDRPAVMLIRDALEQVGIDVWFDRNPDALRIGEDFELKIKTNIDQCSLFIPIISEHTLTPKPRFFRTEWNHAQQLAGRYPDNWRFIIPVAIDDTPPDTSAVPEKFRKLHWERLPGGQTHIQFVEEIKRLYRAYQRNFVQSA